MNALEKDKREPIMPFLILKYPKCQVDLALILALWIELTREWRPDFAGNPFDLPMPRYNAKVTLEARLEDDEEYAYSFDVICRLAGPRRDTMQAVRALFNDPNNSQWMQRVPYPNGLPRKKGTRRNVGCVELTPAAKAYWGNLLPEKREHAIAAAEKLLDADIESGETIVSVLPPVPEQEPLQPAPIAHKVVVYDRRALLQQLVHDIQYEPFIRKYRKKPLDREAIFGWDNRLKFYYWPKPTIGYATTCHEVQEMLDQAEVLANALRLGHDWDNEQQAAAIDLANNIFAWGGVPQDPDTVTADNVRRVFDDALHANANSCAPMNSGWTKVAAFATAHLESTDPTLPQVIWDSRVATAVVSRLDQLITDARGNDPSDLFPRIGTVPGRGGSRPRTHVLKNWPNGYRRWDAQVEGSALVREIRDLLNDSAANYPRMPMPDGSLGQWTTRGVEMVLFMDGY
jgi:hypothetical protein